MDSNLMKQKLKKGLQYFVAILMAVITFFPLIITLLNSLKSNDDILLGMFKLPRIWRFSNYPEAIATANAVGSITRSLLIAIATLVLVIVVAMPGAYAIARKPYKYLKAIYILFMAGVMVPVHCTLVSINRMANVVSGKNNYLFLILVYAAFNLSQAIFLFTSYIRSIDRGMDEAAKIDGCSDLQLLVRILLPICGPIIATEAILVFIYGYSELIFSLILINKDTMYTVSRAILNFTSNYTTSYGPEFAFIILAMIPMLVIYLFLHEKVADGMMAGAIKG